MAKTTNQDKKYDYRPTIFYALLMAIVMLPLFKPGYVLTLDMVFTPKIALSSSVGPDYPLWAVLHYLNLVLPSQLIEKSILVGILFLSGYGMHRLMRRLQQANTSNI